jgi:NADPH2:quinone reductase
MKMRGIVATGKGGPEVLSEQSVELVWPAGPEDVLVRLHAASVNPADIWFRKLGPYIQSSAPLILGHDGSGLVEEVGSRVRRVVPGDAICFCNGGIGGVFGTYAEFAIVPERQLVHIPPAIDLVHAAALPLVTITMWEALVDRIEVRPGEHVLIHGGAGGTGHIGIQLAKVRGARIATTVSTDKKAEFADSFGVDLVIPYREADFVAMCRAWTSGHGLDAAVDNVGRAELQKTFRAMAPYGRIVTLMGIPGDDAETTAYNLNLTLHAVMMLTPMWFGLDDRLEHQAQLVDSALCLVSQGELKVHVDQTFLLSEVAEAHRYIEDGQAIGKVVLTMGTVS